MGDSQNLHRKIEEDIRKTGFISEMQATRIFLNRKWDVQVSGAYTDRDSGKDREYDILAGCEYFDFDEGTDGPIVELYFEMCVEVKKSKYPWVLLKKPSHMYGGPNLFSGSLHAFQDSIENASLFMFTESPWQDKGWFAYGIHEAFKKPNEHSSSYDALMSAYKAAQEIFDWRTEIFVPKWPDSKLHNPTIKPNPSHVLVRPVVVVDAPLYSAELLPNGSSKANKIEWGIVDFRFGTPNYPTRVCQIDVVQLDFLNKYLESVEEHLEQKFHALSNFALKN
jgi:hypothetical protein